MHGRLTSWLCFLTPVPSAMKDAWMETPAAKDKSGERIASGGDRSNKASFRSMLLLLLLGPCTCFCWAAGTGFELKKAKDACAWYCSILNKPCNRKQKS